MKVRDVALCRGHDVHAGERQPLEQSGSVLLVSTESVQCLCEHDIESLVQRVAHQCLEAGTKQRRAGDRVIGELVNDRPPLASRELPAHPELVSDRRFALVVR